MASDDWKPLPGPQTRFLRLKCFEALFGGSAGGAKSESLLVDALRYVAHPQYGRYYTGLILRRTFADIEKSLIVRTHVLYPRLGAVFNEQKRFWSFPSGARIYFGHCENQNDVHQYIGAAFQFVGFDELTTFTEYQYNYLQTRIRSAQGVPCRLRATTNPGGPGHDWVFRRFGAWLDPESPVKGKPGEILYFKREDDVEQVVPKNTPGALSRTFIPSKLSDNPYLAKDGLYEASLRQMDLVTRERYLNGNWLIKPAEGAYFKSHYFEIVDAAPAEGRMVRYWDLAASEAKRGTDPDWTVGIKMSRAANGLFYVHDMRRVRTTALGIEALIKQTAELDGVNCQIHLPQDPGQAGKSQVAYLINKLAGFNVRSSRESGDKVTRCLPVSAQAEAGNVKIVRGEWNKKFLEELEQFPEGSHDDVVDSLSGAFSAVLNMRVPTGTSSSDFLDY